LVSQRATLESRRQNIRGISLPDLTAAQVREQTRQSIIARQGRVGELERLKTVEIKKLDPFEKELTKFEQSIISVESQLASQRQRQSDFEQAKKLFRKGLVDPGASPQIKKFIREFQAGREIALTKQIREAVAKIEEKGLKAIPEIVRGKLVAIKAAPIIKPVVVPREKITFGQPEKFARSFQQATGSTSFTIAIPTRRENGKIRVQDFNFRFEDGKLVKSTPTGTALLTEEQFLEADRRRREKIPGFTFGTTIPTIPRPKAILALGELPPPVGIIEPPSKIKQFFRKIEKKIPVEKRGIVKFLGLEREIVRPGVIPTLVPPAELVTADIRPFIPTGEGTAIVTPRQKTFFEKSNINPKDPSSIKLFEEVQRIESEFDNELISESVANQRLETASDDFTQAQIKKGVPRDLAFGVAFGIIAALPFVGIPAQIALAGDIILKRREIVKQFQKFPRETALSTASFIVGGLIGSGTVKGIRAKLPAEIKPETLRSAVFLTLKQKNKLIKSVAEIDSTIRVSLERGKVTDTTAYRIVTADGRKFDILEFSKVIGKAPDKVTILKGAKEFIGLEVGRGAKGEVLLGRAAQVLIGSRGETFIRAIRLKLARTPQGKLVQRFFGRGQVFDIVQRTKQVGVITAGKLQRISLETKTGIVRVSTAKANLIRRSLKVIDEIKKGKRINLNLIRTLINIQKRLDGEKPFTSKEFLDAGSKTLTNTEILTILEKLSLSGILKITPELRAGKLVAIEKRVGIGVAITKPIIEKIPLKKPTPLKVTFPPVKKPPILKPKITELKDKFGRFRESKLVRADKKKVTQKPFQSGVREIVRVPSRDPFPLEEIPTRFPPGALAPGIALALARPLRAFTLPRTAPRVTTTFGERLNTKTLTAQILSLKNQTRQLERMRTQLKQVTSPSQFTQSRLKNVQDTIVKLRLSLRQFQRLRNFTRQVPTRTVKITGGGGKVILFPSASEVKVKRKLVSPILPISRTGYNVFVKSRGKFKRVNINPLRKSRALDLGSFVTDQSLAATFKISKTNVKAKPPKIKFPKGYFLRTNKKFRAKLIKGKPVKNLAVEKKKFRLDTLREVNKIQAARFISQLRKTALKKIKPFKFKRIK
ncbi:hypothetical protein LCGC14_1176130, partial [marine sediment metagenome]